MDIESIAFRDENGAEHMFYVEEQTRINGTDYLLVTDAPEGDAEALILKDISEESDPEAEFVPVEDPVELDSLMRIFSEMLTDTDFGGSFEE